MEGELKVMVGKKHVKHKVVLFTDLVLYLLAREKNKVRTALHARSRSSVG